MSPSKHPRKAFVSYTAYIGQGYPDVTAKLSGRSLYGKLRHNYGALLRFAPLGATQPIHQKNQTELPALPPHSLPRTRGTYHERHPETALFHSFFPSAQNPPSCGNWRILVFRHLPQRIRFPITNAIRRHRITASSLHCASQPTWLHLSVIRICFFPPYFQGRPYIISVYSWSVCRPCVVLPAEELPPSLPRFMRRSTAGLHTHPYLEPTNPAHQRLSLDRIEVNRGRFTHHTELQSPVPVLLFVSTALL